MAVCPSCQNDNPRGTAACEHCGFELLPPNKPVRKTRLEAPSRAAPAHAAPAPAARPQRTSPFDRPPTQPPPSSAFDHAPTARKTVLLNQPKQAELEPIAAVMVAFKAPGEPGQLFRLRHGRNTLGRAADADIALDDEAVSESHAYVFVDERGGRFLDVSTNGSIVGTTKVHGDQATLEAGTTLLVGSTVLVFTPLQQPTPTIWGMR